MSFLLYAFTAGALATLNPCGFALLPGILGRFLSQGRGGVRSGLGLGLLLSLGTLTIFGGIGLVFLWVGSTLGRYLPYLNLLLGLGLLVMGVLTLIGRGWGLNLQLRTPRGQGFGQFYGFGLAYGLASLGCTMPVFLSVAGFALSQGSVSAATTLLAYGLGMGTVLTGVSLLVGLGKEGLLRHMRQGGMYLETPGAQLLLLAGGYLVGYQLALIMQAPTLARGAGIGLGLLAFAVGYWIQQQALREVADAR